MVNSLNLMLDILKTHHSGLEYGYSDSSHFCQLHGVSQDGVGYLEVVFPREFYKDVEEKIKVTQKQEERKFVYNGENSGFVQTCVGEVQRHWKSLNPSQIHDYHRTSISYDGASLHLYSENHNTLSTSIESDGHGKFKVLTGLPHVHRILRQLPKYIELRIAGCDEKPIIFGFTIEQFIFKYAIAPRIEK